MKCLCSPSTVLHFVFESTFFIFWILSKLNIEQYLCAINEGCALNFRPLFIVFKRMLRINYSIIKFIIVLLLPALNLKAKGRNFLKWPRAYLSIIFITDSIIWLNIHVLLLSEWLDIWGKLNKKLIILNLLTSLAIYSFGV